MAGGATTAHAASSAPSGAAGPAGRLRAGVMPVFGAGVGSTRSTAASSTLPPDDAHLVYYGGPVISRVHVIQVLYGSPGGAVTYEPEVQDTTASPSIARFYNGITTSTYIGSMSEYSTADRPQGARGTNQTIAGGVFTSQVAITPSALNDPFSPGNTTHTIDDIKIQNELRSQITAGSPLPAPTTDSGNNILTLYAVYFPHGVTITIHNSNGSISKSGRDFCAYHGTTSSPEAYYSVLPDFTTDGMSTGCGNNPTEVQNVTAVSSHELAEAITDPEVGLLTSSTAGPPLAWYDPNNGENGDLCNGIDGTTTGGDGVTYTVQKIWSNKQDACVVAAAPPPPPPPPHFAPQGVGAPQVAVTPDGSTQLVFWKGSNNLLAEAWYTGVWNGPITFPQLGALTSTPSVTVTKDGSTQLVFWQGPGGHLFEAWYTGVWNGPVDMTSRLRWSRDPGLLPLGGDHHGRPAAGLLAGHRRPSLGSLVLGRGLARPGGLHHPGHAGIGPERGHPPQRHPAAGLLAGDRQPPHRGLVRPLLERAREVQRRRLDQLAAQRHGHHGRLHPAGLLPEPRRPPPRILVRGIVEWPRGLHDECLRWQRAADVVSQRHRHTRRLHPARLLAGRRGHPLGGLVRRRRLAWAGELQRRIDRRL